ncbi:MAG TPA: sugar transferase [Thermodesulfobacteriota bacterium]|nr:sugar transferase [Thermodesulfobacteriota bacterium]
MNTKESYLKRPFDLLLSFIGLVISFPLWVIISAAIYLEDGRPIFYSQTRLGKKGRVFKLLKFRSMIKDAEQQTGAVWANKEDHRITKIGGFLRRTALDELPQLLNIFKGDMSFVGPRAERPEIAREILKEIPDFNDRLLVLPGLTGLAQVYGNYNTPPRKKLRYDLLYIKNQSFWLDLKLILISFWITFTFKWSEREKRAERLIGQIMLEAGVITDQELNDALEHQRVWGGKVGENLIQLGYITHPELRHFLNLQVVQNGKGSWIIKNNDNGSHKLIGQILLESGVITEEQLMDGLENQRVRGGKIGENLVKKGYISESQVAYFLNKQLEMNS